MRRGVVVLALAWPAQGCAPGAPAGLGWRLVVGADAQASAPPRGGPGAVGSPAEAALSVGQPEPPPWTGGPRVLTVGAGRPRPVRGGWVASLDGRRVAAGPDGGFSWEGPPPADGTWVVGAEGHVTSLVGGLGPDAPQAFHLVPLAATEAAVGGAPAGPVTLTGVVQGPGGEGLPDLLVVLGLPGRAGPAVAITGADGRFTLATSLPARGAAGATLMAAGPRGGHLGIATGLALTGRDAALPPLVAVQGDHALEVRVAGVPSLPAPRIQVVMQGPTGAVLTLEGGAEVRVADLPGVAYGLRVQAVAQDGVNLSRIERPALALDWGRPRTVVTEALLAPPQLTPPARLALGAPVGWAPVAGATGYTVQLTGPRSGGGWPWEAFTASPGVVLALPGGRLEPGAHQLAVSAWDAPGLSARSLAQAGVARALRRVEGGDAGLRVARSEVTVAP